MNTLKRTSLGLGCLLGLLATAAAQSQNATNTPTTPPVDTPAASSAQPPASAEKVAAPDQAQTVPGTPVDSAPAAAVNSESVDGRQKAALRRNSGTGSEELRLNFRNAPVESVLNYLSDAAGFIIVPRTGSDLKGKVTVWSNQPVSKEEALDLLNSALDQNGYTAIRNGRTLTIWNKEDAKKQDLPVKSGNRPEDIPKNDEMVTQIVPVRFISAVQVARDLQPLLPDKATMAANEGGNALIITDTQTSIRRMTEIIKALDTAISSVSSVKVFPLHYADAKAVAAVIKDLFAPQDTARTGTGNNAGAAGRFFNQLRGGGGPGGFGGPGGGAQTGAGAGSGSASGGRAPTPRVVAVAEERSNSLVVNAPEDQMPVIADLIAEVDTNVEDITELRVFRLKYADAEETAELLSNLFSDTGSTSGTQNARSGQIQFGGRLGGAFGAPFGGRTGATANTAGQSDRTLKQSKVVAVPDLRTGSVVVSAARDLMVQIAKMIEDLDSDPAKKQQVFVFDVQNTDPSAVQDILQSFFPAPTTGNYNGNRNNSRQQTGTGNQLNNRATQNQNQGSRSSSGFNTMGTGFGGSSGLGNGR